MAFTARKLVVGTGDAAVSSAEVETVTQLTAGQNDYAPGTDRVQRWSSDASRTVTGMAAGATAEERIIINSGSFDIVFSHQSASSTAANRFLSTTGASITLGADAILFAIYDATTARWRISKLPVA